MHTIICSGGSGLRVLESIIHLCAAGLGPQELRIVAVDPDGANGNLSRLRTLIESYIDCHQYLGSSSEYNFFQTKLNLLNKDSKSAELGVWSPVNIGEDLKSVIGYHNLSPEFRDIAHLLFTKKELDTKLDEGFRGHPAIGAAAMSLMHFNSDQWPWDNLKKFINQDISQPNGSTIMIVGSVFGGTGASSLYPLARFLRTMPETNNDLLKIGVAALVPYFRFDMGSARFSNDEKKKKELEEMAAKSEWFSLATKSALEYYDHLWNYERQGWPLDAMFWVGNDAPVDVEYSKGGPTQKNPSHFVDLMAAMAILEYLNDPNAVAAQKQSYYSGPQSAEGDIVVQNKLGWKDFPLLNTALRDNKRRDTLLFCLTGFVHMGFFHELFEEKNLYEKPHHVTWYFSRFARQHDWLSTKRASEFLMAMNHFFKSHHFRWWREILQVPAAQLLNSIALKEEIDLQRLTSLTYEQRKNVRPEAFDIFYKDMIKAARKSMAEKGGVAYWNLLSHAADEFIKREYDI